MNYTVCGILQARILEWVAVPFSSVSSWPKVQTEVSRIAGEFFTNWATRKPIGCEKAKYSPKSKDWQMRLHNNLVVVQLTSHVQLLTVPWTTARQASLSFTIFRSLQVYFHWMGNASISFCHPLLLLLSVSPSIMVFSSALAVHIRWPKYWSFSFGISHSNVYSGLISFRIDWFDLLVSKGRSKVFSSTTVQNHQFFSVVFMVQLSHP